MMRLGRSAAAALLGAAVFSLVLAAPAAADTGDGGGGLQLALEDSHGIPWDRFALDIYFGSVREANDGQQLWAGMQSFFWGFYHFLMGMLIYIADWAMSLEWAAWVTAPLASIGRILEGQFDQLDIRVLVLSILGLIVGFWMFRGRIGTGLGNLVIGLLILAMVGGFLATPISMVADSEDGLIYNARDAGSEIATTITGDEAQEQAPSQEATADRMHRQREALNAAMVDVLIRLPHQVINYGEVLDGTACEAVYDAAIVDDSRRPHDVINDASECPERLYDYAHHPSVASMSLAWSVMPAATLFFLVTVVLLLLLVVSVAGTLWSGIQIIWNGVLAALPGQSRSGLTKNLAVLVGGSVIIAGLIVAWIGWLSVIQSIMSMGQDEIPFIVRLWVFNILILVGGIVLILFRHRVTKRLKGVAQRLATLGSKGTESGPKPPSVVDKGKSAAARSVTSHLSRVAANRAGVSPPPSSSRRPQPVPSRPQPVPSRPQSVPSQSEATPARKTTTPSAPRNAPSSSTVDEAVQAPTSAAPAAESTQDPSDPYQRADRFKSRLKTGGKVAFHVGLATLSGGTSLVAKGAHVAWKAKKTHESAKAMREYLARHRASSDQAQQPKPASRPPAPKPATPRPKPDSRPNPMSKPQPPSASSDPVMSEFTERNNKSADFEAFVNDPNRRAQRLRERVGSRK